MMRKIAYIFKEGRVSRLKENINPTEFFYGYRAKKNLIT